MSDAEHTKSRDVEHVPWNCWRPSTLWPEFESLGLYMPLLDRAALEQACQLIKCRFPEEEHSAIEIGSFVGTSTNIIASNGFQVHAIDTWSGGTSPDWINGLYNRRRDIREIFNTNTERFSKRIIPYKGRSELMAHEFPDNYFHLLWIDGDHSYEAVKSDIQLYLPKLKPGCLIMGHDYSHEFPGVEQAVHELLPNAVRWGWCCWCSET